MTLGEALEVLAALDREGVDLVVIGSMAMAARPQDRIDAERIRDAFGLESD